MALIPFNFAADVGDRFLSLLDDLGISPSPGSPLEDELLSLTSLIEMAKQPSLAKGARRVEILRAASGLHDLAAKVLAAKDESEFSHFVSHLKLIANNGVPLASILQNGPSGKHDDTARKMVELYIGCLAVCFAHGIDLDSPTAARGDNPDVMFTVRPNEGSPERWAIAIKTISTTQGQTIFERIEGAADQIRTPRCNADKGLILINAKGALDHDALWDTEFDTVHEAVAALKAQLDGLMSAAEQDRPQEQWDALFGPKVVRPILFMGQSLVQIKTALSDQTLTALKVMVAYDANGAVDSMGASIAYYLNHAMQAVLKGLPGEAEGISP